MDMLSLSEIANMAGAKILQGDSHLKVSRVSKDTRSLQAGDLYLALRGERFDGNEFASEAIERGASVIMLDSKEIADQLVKGFPVLLADNSYLALHRMAEAWRSRLQLKALCITGSNGKTSTKEFTAAILSSYLRVTKTEGNLNNHIGVPLSILEAGSSDQAAVWEIGMNHPGEIAPLAKLAQPDVAIITNIGVAHIEYLKTRDAIAQEKGMLAEAVSPKGVVILSADDDKSDTIAARCRSRVVRAGLSGGDLTAESIVESQEGCSFSVRHQGKSFPARIPANGVHMVRNALLALAAGLEFQVPLDQAIYNLSQARLVGGRLQHRLIRGVLFLDDTYNANPDSMEAALATLRAFPGNGRRIAVLGKIGEMGAYSDEGYRRTGAAAGHMADILITVGEETSMLAAAARDAGLTRIHETDDKISATRTLAHLVSPGDIVLIKGSRSARMEDILKHFDN